MVKKSSSSTSTSSSPSSALVSISTHEHSLTVTSPADPNPLLPLISLSRHSSAEVVHKAIWALYRVFLKIVEEGKLYVKLEDVQGKKTSNGKDRAKEMEEQREESESRKMVAKWIRERLNEYIEVLGGLMRDSEASLRKSASSILLNLISPLSASISLQSSTHILSLPYIHHLTSALLNGSSSLRGASLISSTSSQGIKKTGEWKAVDENQWRAGEENGRSLLPDDVRKEWVGKLVENDDLRWGFFNEASSILEQAQLSGSIHPTLSSNALALILPLNNLPQQTADINTFICPHIGIKPSKVASSVIPGNKKLKTGKKVEKKKNGKGKKEEGQDWLAYYESESQGSDEDDSENENDDDQIVGAKRKRADVSTTTGGRKKENKQGMHKEIWDVNSHKRGFTRCWLGLLGLPMSDAETRSILLVLHSTILPNMTRGKVVRLTDWLGGLCDKGGPLALLSLNGLYLLIRDYNLEYPNFYRRLYGLMDREVMHVKYRARFFRLTETFLSSPLLPASLVASFIKRLAQLSLSAPPAAIIMIIPFIYNLLKKHPACMMMLQSETILPEGFVYVEPFNASEKDPLKSGALDSSLWELKSLQNHYLSHVATMAKIFGEVFTKPEFVMEDFLDHGYSTLFETEMSRKIRSAPALATDKVEVPFPTASVSQPKVSGQGEDEDEDDYVPPSGDLISELWSFGV